MYNTEYRRVKRILDKHNGDTSKIREELGFDVPTRAKRQKRSNADKQSQSGSNVEGAPVSGNLHLPEAPVSGTSDDREAPQPNATSLDAEGGSAPTSEIAGVFRFKLNFKTITSSVALH